MSVQDVNVEKLDVQEAKKASYGVNAEVPDATGVNATPPGNAPQAGDKSGPTTQGSGIKPYTKVGMINAMVQSLGSMKKMEVSSAYDAMHGKKSKPVAEVSHDSGKNAKMSKITKEDIDITQDIEAIFAGADVSAEFITTIKSLGHFSFALAPRPFRHSLAAIPTKSGIAEVSHLKNFVGIATLRAIPAPNGLCHSRCNRPRPFNCSSAVIAKTESGE
jgi:hypothetical protein